MTANSPAELAAINCIPGALCSSATTTSNAISRFRSTRKSCHVVSILDPKIGVAAIRDHYQKGVCRKDAGYARWLSQQVFRYLPESDGTPRLKTYRKDSYWWEHSLEDWADECICTVKQVRGYLARAVKDGLIEKNQWRSFRGKYQGKTVLHTRLLCAHGAASLNGWPDYSQIGMIPECPFVTCYSNAPEGNCKDLKKEALKQEQNLNIKNANEQPFAKDTSGNLTPDSGTTNQPKTNPKGKFPPSPVETKPSKPEPAKPEPAPNPDHLKWLEADLLVKLTSPSKSMEEPSVAAVAEWARFEQDFIEAHGTPHGKPCIVPGWPKAKRQAIQRFEFEMTCKGDGGLSLAVLRWLTPAIWQKVALNDVLENPIANPLYLKSHTGALLAAYLAPFVAEVKASSYRAFEKVNHGGVKGMRYKVQSAIKKATKFTQEATATPMVGAVTAPSSQAEPQAVVAPVINPDMDDLYKPVPTMEEERAKFAALRAYCEAGRAAKQAEAKKWAKMKLKA
jgi:hypothetical protein